MTHIDLNCDLGESYGTWRMGDDDALLAQISSANIACGFHAGDPDIMRATVRQALAHDVAIGAHVSLPDLQGFGRREMAISPNEAYALTLYQIGALHAFAQAAGSRLRHVKPHGALYNMAARDAALAAAIASATRDFDPRLALVGLAGSIGLDAARTAGLRTIGEGFADRRYRADGSLQSRRAADALIEDRDEAIAQALALAQRRPIHAVDGAPLQLRVDSLCLHGDGAHAVEFAHALRQALEGAGLRVAAEQVA